MNHEAARMALGLSEDASPEEIEAAYRNRHNDLQQRILQAPIEGLKEKYRKELSRVELARKALLGSDPANPGDLPAVRPTYQSAQKPRSPKRTAKRGRQQAPPPAEPTKGGAGKYIVLAMLILLAGAGFVYLTQAGPLKGWWKETMRDQALVAEIQSMATQTDDHAADWESLHAEIGGEQFPEVGEAHRAAERARRHFNRLDDAQAMASYEEAVAHWSLALTRGQERLSRQRAEELDRACSEGERAKVLQERLEQAQRRISDDLREAASKVRSLEGSSGANADELGKAKVERDYHAEYDELSRKSVFEGKGLEEMRQLMALGNSQLRREDSAATLASFSKASETAERLLDELTELEDVLRDLSDANLEVSLASIRIVPQDRDLLGPAVRELASARKQICSGQYEAARESLRKQRGDNNRVVSLLVELADAGRNLSAAVSRAAPEDRELFANAQNLLGSARSRTRSGNLPLAQTMLRAHRAAVQSAEGSARSAATMREQTRKDFESLPSSLRESAARGDANSMNTIGTHFHNGLGVKRNYVEAMRWYRLAASRGSSHAMSNMSMLYSDGKGVEKDEGEAMRWCRMAADKGNPHGMCNVGYMYNFGRGVQRDYGEAMRWYRKAAEKGNAAAERYIGQLYEHGQGVKADKAEAIRWYRQAADKGDKSAIAGLERLK